MSEIQEELNKYRQTFVEKAPQQKQDDYERGIKEVRTTGVEQRAKKVGDFAPLFTLPSLAGQQVSLEALLKKGPVVLVWYRGGWCPYCNIYLNGIKTLLAQVKQKNASLVAITPELAEKAIETKEKHQLPFTVLCDVGNVVAQQYEIAYRLPDYISEYYKSFAVNERNGDKSNVLPLSATYVIAKNGKITYAFANADYRLRAEPAEIVKSLS